MLEVRKTDVIFLGAGASACATFPVNEKLTHYLIYELVRHPRFQGVSREWVTKLMQFEGRKNEIFQDWIECGESLRRSKVLSVDEFCQIATRTDEKNALIGHLKRMVLT